MHICRRDFLKYCGLTAATVGLSGTELLRLEEVLANPATPTVLWLQGSACTGCSMSFLNYVSPKAPTSAADLLINNINLAYHPNLMTTAGQDAAEAARAAYDQGGYILAVEGGVPMAFGGRACWAWTYNGVDVTFSQAVKSLASRASKILAIGTCASFGGIPAAGSNPTKVRRVSVATGKPTINISGCPPHPDWIVHTVAQLLLGKDVPLTSSRRPKALFGKTVHSACPRNHSPESCLAPQGCRGPGTQANCPVTLWNNGINWCVNADAPCYACTEPSFPGAVSLYAVMYNHVGTTDLNCSSCHNDKFTSGGGAVPNNPHGYTVNNCADCHK
jgi:hydrogenase small subunit